jgi:SAM-dependent methyltransferase
LHADVPNCTFEILDDRGLMAHPDRSVDCVYSRLVLQHVPSRSAIEAYLRDFVRVLADGGLLVVQLPASLPMRRRLQVRPRLYATLRHLRLPEDVLYRRLGLHPIRMRSIPEADVVRLLTAAGATVLDVERSEMGDMGIQDRTYWATKAR